MRLKYNMWRNIEPIVNKIPVIFLPLYWLSFLMPRNRKVWAFGSSLGKSFAGNPKYFYLYVNERNEDIRPIWISEDDRIISKLKSNGYEAYNIYSFKGIWFSLRSGVYIFDHYTKDISFWLSGRAIKVNLWHGIPLKKVHRDNKFDKVRNPQTLYDKVRWIFRRIQNEKPSHYYAVTSEFIEKLHTRAFNALSERVFVCGYARNDILFSNSYLSNKETITVNNNKFYSDIKSFKSNGYKVVVYMPTFRESEKQFFEVVNLEKFNDFLIKSKVVFIVKAHHLSKLTEKFNAIDYSNIKNIKATDDPYPYLSISDVLMTDYSSVYFDYLLTDKPIIFFSYDLESYMNESRELYYDYDSVTPGFKARNMDDLMHSIECCVDNKDDFKIERKEILDKMFDYDDGNSSERLYNKILKIIYL